MKGEGGLLVWHGLLCESGLHWSCQNTRTVTACLPRP